MSDKPEFRTIEIRRQFGHRVSVGAGVPVPNFSEARRLFNAYRVQREQGNDPLLPWMMEVEHRLADCEWIVRRIDALQSEYEKLAGGRWLADSNAPSPEHDQNSARMGDIATEVSILTEAFYGCAWRCHEVLANHLKCKGFDPKGIRRVRYEMLDHAQVAKPAFSSGRHSVRSSCAKGSPTAMELWSKTTACL